MPRDSIFTGVVISENSYTRLLHNLMQRQDAFRNAVLSKLFTKAIAQQISSDSIHVQKVLRDSAGNHGTADLFIRTPYICGVVEIKTELGRDTTYNQRWSFEEAEEQDARGYLKYLGAQATPERWFVFLTPRGWKNEHFLGTHIREMSDPTVKIRTVTWEELFVEIDEKMRIDPLIDEFRLHLAKRFEPISFNQAEIDMLTNPDIIETVWKLNKLIMLIFQKAKSSGYTLKWERPHQWSSYSYGFYFMHESKYRLYFGCWLSFAKTVSLPLCIGVEDKWGDEVRNEFTKCSPFDVVAFIDPDPWTLSGSPASDLDTADASDKVWESIQPILRRVPQR